MNNEVAPDPGNAGRNQGVSANDRIRSPSAIARRILEGASWLHTRVLIIWIVLMSLSFLLLLGLGSFIWLRNQALGEQLVLVQPAGRVLSISLPQRFWFEALVETDSGWYVVRDAMSLKKGELLSLERFANNDRYLCDAEHYCVELAYSRWSAGVTFPKQVH